jgi:hypothetical protein
MPDCSRSTPRTAAGPSGENTSHSTGSNVPTPVIQSVFRSPTAVPSTPPSSPPSGVVPHMTNRIVAFIRPSRWSGQIVCR